MSSSSEGDVALNLVGKSSADPCELFVDCLREVGHGFFKPCQREHAAQPVQFDVEPFAQRQVVARQHLVDKGAPGDTDESNEVENRIAHHGVGEVDESG